MLDPDTSIQLAGLPIVLSGRSTATSLTVRIWRCEDEWTELEEVPRWFESTLTSLQEPTTLTQLRSQVSPINQPELDELVSHLVCTGGIQQVRTWPIRSRIAITGRGSLAKLLYERLTNEGGHAVWLRESWSLAASQTSHGNDTSGNAPPTGEWIDIDGLDPTSDVVLIANDVPSLNIEQALYFNWHHVSHLFVRAHPHAMVVGPLVIPKQTACLVCRCLHVSDEDSKFRETNDHVRSQPTRIDSTMIDILWPTLREYLIHRRSFEQSLRSADDVQQADLTILSPVGASVRRWASHPECSCRGNQPTTSRDI